MSDKPSDKDIDRMLAEIHSTGMTIDADLVLVLGYATGGGVSTTVSFAGREDQGGLPFVIHCRLNEERLAELTQQVEELNEATAHHKATGERTEIHQGVKLRRK